MSRSVGVGRRAAVLFAVLMVAVVAVLSVGASGAWADADHCKSETGYKVCGPASGGDAGGGDGSGSAVGSAVVQAGGSEDLPVTGTSPVRSVVIGAAFIVVGAAAVAGSKARRRAGAAH